MKEKLLITEGGKNVPLKYLKESNESYRGNPLIEVLPDTKNDIEVIEALCNYPLYSQFDRQMSKENKILRIKQLYHFYQPFDIHVQLYKDIDFMIKEAYVSRNPLKYKEFNERIYENYNNLQSNKVGVLSKRSVGMGKALIGTAGIGKTSSISKILDLFPRVLMHTKYKEQELRFTQITYLSVLAPYDSSLKALLLNILSEVDELIGTSYYDKAIRSKGTINMLIAQVQQIVTTYHVGLIVIDEFQFLDKKAEQVINFLTSIMNVWGVSLYLVGTPPVLEVLQRDLRVARRFQLLIYEKMKKESKEWNYLLQDLWQYQYTLQIMEVTEEISNCFYYYSQGITDLLIKLFIEVQIEAVERNKKVTVSLIKEVFKSKMGMTTKIVQAIQSNDKYQLNQYSDIL